MTSPIVRGFPQKYEDHLWYPILVKIQGAGYHRIVEMQGKAVNAHNDMVGRQNQHTCPMCHYRWST